MVKEKRYFTGAVLIGGKSRRFGTDKVVCPVAEKPMAKKVIELVSRIFDGVILIGHPRKELNDYKIIEDIVPDRGSLGGIFTALSVAKGEYVFVFGADMPFLNVELIKYMITVTDKHDIIIPRWSKGIEPLHAVYRKSLIPNIKSLIEKDYLKISTLIEMKDISTLEITEEKIRSFGDPEKIFFNVNTPDDFKCLISTSKYNS